LVFIVKASVAVMVVSPAPEILTTSVAEPLPALSRTSSLPFSSASSLSYSGESVETKLTVSIPSTLTIPEFALLSIVSVSESVVPSTTEDL
jgi:hypothetical protein